jgi:hypothetical protein
MADHVDPLLSKAIRKGIKADDHVHAAFTLRDNDKGELLSPEMTDRIVKDLVSRVSRETARAAKTLVVFKNLQSFSIDAPASLVAELTKDDAIGTAALGS